ATSASHRGCDCGEGTEESHQHHGCAEKEYAGERTRQGAGRGADTMGKPTTQCLVERSIETWCCFSKDKTKPTLDGALVQCHRVAGIGGAGGGGISGIMRVALPCSIIISLDLFSGGMGLALLSGPGVLIVPPGTPLVSVETLTA